MEMITFDIDPVSKPRMTQRDKHGWSQSDAAQRYFAFVDHINLLARCMKFEIGNQIDVIFNIEMPPSWSKKRQALMLGKPCKSKPDTDNLIKAFCDALTTDDSGIWDKRGRKFLAAKGSIIVVSNTFDESR